MGTEMPSQQDSATQADEALRIAIKAVGLDFNTLVHDAGKHFYFSNAVDGVLVRRVTGLFLLYGACGDCCECRRLHWSICRPANPLYDLDAFIALRPWIWRCCGEF